MLLTIGYMVARGIAKSGNRDYYDARLESPPALGCSPARENTAAAAQARPSLVACGQSDEGARSTGRAAIRNRHPGRSDEIRQRRRTTARRRRGLPQPVLLISVIASVVLTILLNVIF